MIPLLVLCTLSFSITVPVRALANVRHDISPHSAITHAYEHGVSTATENIRENLRQALQVITDQFAEPEERRMRQELRGFENEKRVLREEFSGSRYGREAVQVHGPESKASLIHKRDEKAVQVDDAHVQIKKASSVSKRDVPECSAVGTRYDLSTTSLHNCSGSLIPTTDFEAYYSDLACQNCVGSNAGATCQRRCCRPAVIEDPKAVLCRCPADYTGNQCEELRPWSCSINYISPGDLGCSSPSVPIDTDVYGRDDCYKFSKGNSSVTFLFNATCSQVDPLLDQGFEGGQFPYYAKTSKLALSKDPQLSIMAKISNFHRISDLAQARQIFMSPEMYTGYQQYGFLYNMTELTQSGSPYFVGGRLYMEAAFQTKDASQPEFLDQEGTFRTYIDFYDIPRPDFSQNQNTYLGGLSPIGIILVSVACFIVVARVLVLRARKKKED